MVVENQQVDMEGSDKFAILTDSINTFQMDAPGSRLIFPLISYSTISQIIYNLEK
jgi:hypothetical protein